MSVASAFATYRRLGTGAFGAPSAVLRPWYSPEKSEGLQAVDLVGDRLLEAMIRIVHEGPRSEVRLTGEVETDNYTLEALAVSAAATGSAKGLEEWRGRRPVIRSFSAWVGPPQSQVRAELRSDGVVTVFSEDRESALSAAEKLLSCALSTNVEISR